MENMTFSIYNVSVIRVYGRNHRYLSHIYISVQFITNIN